MSTVISIRVPRRLKEKMDRLKSQVNWSEEVRKFLEYRVEQLYRKVVLEDIREIIEQVPESKKGTSARYVREDRDSN